MPCSDLGVHADPRAGFEPPKYYADWPDPSYGFRAGDGIGHTTRASAAQSLPGGLERSPAETLLIADFRNCTQGFASPRRERWFPVPLPPPLRRIANDYAGARSTPQGPTKSERMQVVTNCLWSLGTHAVSGRIRSFANSDPATPRLVTNRRSSGSLRKPSYHVREHGAAICRHFASLWRP
jgi:hypothetical protein